MGFFRDIRISMADKKVQTVIVTYLNNLNALPKSQEFSSAVEKLIGIFWGDSLKRRVCEEKGFDKEDLCYLFVAMVAVVLPNPVIQGSAPLLVATLPFMEFQRLDIIMSGIKREIGSSREPEERQRVILKHAKFNADLIYNTHLTARGPAKLFGQGSVGV